ncbi:MAG: T9SS type A sorting domain-containing protein, partial [Ignavibacteriaceae bacterium]|nr:T9SS type A sorting domain-containing protein [Ignavibacteriaceae bacterium]
QQWIIRYNGSGDGDDYANTVALDTIGNVYITGSSVGTGTAEDIVTIKYSQTPTSVHESQTNLPDNYFLYQNYPNPFNPSTKIKYQIPELSFITLKVYDVLGNEIVTLTNEEKLAGSYGIEFNAANLPSGIYFYRLQAGSFVGTKKMVLLR